MTSRFDSLSNWHILSNGVRWEIFEKTPKNIFFSLFVLIPLYCDIEYNAIFECYTNYMCKHLCVDLFVKCNIIVILFCYDTMYKIVCEIEDWIFGFG